MKIGYIVFKVFKSARLQDKALYRRSPNRLWDCTGGRCTAYVCDALFEKGRFRRAPVQTKISGDLVNLPAQHAPSNLHHPGEAQYPLLRLLVSLAL